MRAAGLALAVLAVLPGCVMLPQTTYQVDPACGTTWKRMELAPVQFAAIHGCSHDGCVALLAAAGVTAAASTVVSGSIAIVGNVAYWLERQAAPKTACTPVAPPSAAPLPRAPAAAPVLP